MLAVFLNKKVSVLRLAVTTGNRRAYSTVQTAMAEVQNIDTRQQHVVEGVASKTYKAFFDLEENIREGDILRRQDIDQRYKVIGVERKGENLGLAVEHLEVILVKYNF